MRHFVMSAVVLAGALGLWLSAGVHREAPLVGHLGLTPEVAAMEDEVALDPDSVEKLEALCSAYLERKSPGLALAAIHRAPEEVRDQPQVSYHWARALLYEGHASDALARQRKVLADCQDASCSAWLTASAMRQEAFLAALVSHGVEDYRRDPGKTVEAYRSMQATTVAVLDLGQ